MPLRIGGGTRLKIFEAMAMGKAVVSTTVGAEGLPVADGEHLLLADEPRAFARAVVRLLRDRGSARAARSGRPRARGRAATTGRRSPANSKSALTRIARGQARGDRARSLVPRAAPVEARRLGSDRHESFGLRSRLRRLRVGGVVRRRRSPGHRRRRQRGQGRGGQRRAAARSSSPASTSCSRERVADGRLRATTDTADGDPRHATSRCSASARRAGATAASISSYLERVSEQIGAALQRQADLSRRRRPQHGAAGHDARGGDPGARARVGQDVRRRLRRLGQPGVPARRHRAQGFPQAAADARRPQPRRRRQRHDRAVSVDRRAARSAPASASPR